MKWSQYYIGFMCHIFFHQFYRKKSVATGLIEERYG